MTRFHSLIITLLSILPCYGSECNVGLEKELYGYAIIDNTTGKTILSHNDHNMFTPASILKCITAGIALELLGSDFRFETALQFTGTHAGSCIMGNFIVTPSGDPSLGSGFCQHIKNLGINKIYGTISVNATEPYVNPNILLEDIGSDYGVGYSTFNFNNNASLINDTFSQAPEECIIDDFMATLASTGVELDVDSEFSYNNDTIQLTSYKSAVLSNMCRHMLYESDNLYAEAIGRSISLSGSLDESLDRMSFFLDSIGISQGDYVIVDMSGLSRKNLITPMAMATFLRYMSKNSDFIASLPFAGKSGTVKRLLQSTRLEGKLRVKSGSMTGILTYAGYYIDSSGTPTKSFVIMVNNSNKKTSKIREILERWFLKNF